MIQKGNVCEISDQTLESADKDNIGFWYRKSVVGGYFGKMGCEKDLYLPIGLFKKCSL